MTEATDLIACTACGYAYCASKGACDNPMCRANPRANVASIERWDAEAAQRRAQDAERKRLAEIRRKTLDDAKRRAAIEWREPAARHKAVAFTIPCADGTTATAYCKRIKLYVGRYQETFALQFNRAGDNTTILAHYASGMRVADLTARMIGGLTARQAAALTIADIVTSNGQDAVRDKLRAAPVLNKGA